MSDIQAVFGQLNDIEGAISSMERSATDEPSFARELALTSLRARRAEYQAMADELSQQHLVDVCDYRIVPDAHNHFPAKAVAGALETFQDMFTAFFGSVRERRPRQKASFDADIVNASTLNVGYAYSGSLGIVMYVPSDRLELDETDQDAAIRTIFELASQTEPEGIRAIAERVGRAPVRRFYEWSALHVDYDISADIKWKRGTETKGEKIIQPAEFRALKEYIERATKETVTSETVEGVLVALDVTRHSFKLSFPEAKDMRGIFDEQFNWKIPHEIPGRYRANVMKRTTVPLWSEVETITWTLLDLESLT